MAFTLNARVNCTPAPDQLRHLKGFRAALEQAGVQRAATPHTLRHSFAAHFRGQGTELRYMQGLPEHSGSRTTEIYTRIAKFGLGKMISPLDGISNFSYL